MKTISSTEFKSRLNEYLDFAQAEPITIDKTGSNETVLISRAEYDRLISMENAYWLKRAKEAESSGYLGTDQSLDNLRTKKTR